MSEQERRWLGWGGLNLAVVGLAAIGVVSVRLWWRVREGEGG